MSTPHVETRSVVPRACGAAVTGAVLAYGAVLFFSWVEHHDARACETTDGLCWTWWDWAAVPVALTAALAVLMIVYGRLGIGPRLAVVLPTVVLGALPLAAAQATAGWWAAALAGGAWSCSLALAAWGRYRIPGLSAAAALLLASLVALYR
ncbi:hypothetical protein PV721_24425 [Streptomyces sp. MB09-01]|uniref:hypothetical protein n=1 Tax=Streptomyces sp. MB09-01 TaxID=3028666 RepID=UPI00299FF0F9|nr:hypothetical protein [Streptomyces sp. MB09-01]MDX3537459.1 hypothetical protein [Streptomyces sp. MB09-01]